MCRLVGRAPNRILQYDVVRTAVRTLLHNFDIKELNIPLFHDEKIYTTRNIKKEKKKQPKKKKKEKNLKLKRLNHVQSDYGIILNLENTRGC